MTDTGAWLAEALARRDAGDRAGAERLCRAVLEAAPDRPDALALLGVLLAEDGRPEEAETHLRRACALDAGHGEAYVNLGILLLDAGRAAEAVPVLEAACRLSPTAAATATNLGVALHRCGRLEEAAGALRRAAALDPADPRPPFNLGSVLDDGGLLEAAGQAYAAALELAPGFAEAWLNLGTVRDRQHRHADAARCYRAALEHGIADRGAALSQLIHQLCALCRWDEAEALRPALLEAVAADRAGTVPPFAVLCQPVGPAWHLRAAGNHAAAVLARAGSPLAPAAPFAGGPLRVGYLSSDFHRHATAYLVAELLERHDRGRVEVAGLSYGPDDGSAMRRRLAAACDCFVDLSGMSDAAAAAVIRELEIDVLVDLKGHTAGARPGIMALRPAPVRVQYLGYPGTLGAGLADYVVADAVLVPPGDERFYSEAVVRLPGCYQPNDAARPVAPTPPRAALGLPDDAFVFACFNAAYKITREVFAIWMRLLACHPGSVLWLLEPAAETKAALLAAAGTQGIAPGRIVWAPWLPKDAMAEHLGRQAAADLFLDTLPVNAHTTASDALWAGLPVLTCRGDAFAGRVAASLLLALGLPELVAGDLAAYEETARGLAADPGRLAALRARLAEARTRPGGPFDAGATARRLEAAYAEMARRARVGLPPGSFDVTE
ncbi:MAG TPA: tetratricopeptide repeat protein [Azospirillaceae bacterium]|nr:tetratricopeptide repeat protein [Azospirillaceae bacterium]